MSAGLVSSMTDRGEYCGLSDFYETRRLFVQQLDGCCQEHGTYGENAKTLAAQAGGA
jgi:hypothetical protein